MTDQGLSQAGAVVTQIDARDSAEHVLRGPRSRRTGISQREAARRFMHDGSGLDLQPIFGTATPETWQVLLLPLLVLVWGRDELWRWGRRRVEPRFPSTRAAATPRGVVPEDRRSQ